MKDTPEYTELLESLNKQRFEPWRPYEIADREYPLPYILPAFFYKIRNTVFSPFYVKNSYFQKSYGFLASSLIIIGVTLFLIYEGFTYTKTWGGIVFNGKATSIIVGLTYLFSSKNLIVNIFTGMLYETQIKLHKILAYCSVSIAYVHGIRVLINTSNFNTRIISGLTMLTCVTILISTGLIFKFLNQYYNIFIKIHKIFFIVLYIGAFIHGAYYVFFFGVFWVWLDIILRFIMSFKNR